MPVVRTLVVLANYGDQGTIHRPRDAVWFHDYFFNPVYGQKAYWLKQSDNNIVLDGQAIDWRNYPYDFLNILDRSAAGTSVIGEVRASLGVDLSQFDLPIVVFGLPPQIGSDGGASNIVMSATRTVRGFVGTSDRDRVRLVGPRDRPRHRARTQLRQGSGACDRRESWRLRPPALHHERANLRRLSRRPAPSIRPTRATAGRNTAAWGPGSMRRPRCSMAGWTRISTPVPAISDP